MRACIIVYNMIVEDERDSYTQYNVLEFQQGEDVDQTFSVKRLQNTAIQLVAEQKFGIMKPINN